MRLVIEAINQRDIPGYFLRTQEQAAAIVAAIGPDRVGLQFDIYHCQTAQGDVTRRLEALMPLIAHMQVADVPGRHEPGTGEIGWEFLFGRIEALGYQGWIGCEYQPAGDTASGLSWPARYGLAWPSALKDPIEATEETRMSASDHIAADRLVDFAAAVYGERRGSRGGCAPGGGQAWCRPISGGISRTG